MGKTPLNPALRQLRGKVDGFVYRRLEGETIVSRLPRTRREVPFNELSPTQERFRMAVLFAQAVCADPVRLAPYAAVAKRRRVRASRLFNFVVQDYLAPPVVTEIRLRDYRGRAGDPIVVFAKDDCEVTAVDVAVKDAAGAILETGPATSTPLGWRYIATTTPAAGMPLTIVATAHDHAGNRTVAEQRLVVVAGLC